MSTGASWWLCNPVQVALHTRYSARTRRRRSRRLARLKHGAQRCGVRAPAARSCPSVQGVGAASGKSAASTASSAGTANNTSRPGKSALREDQSTDDNFLSGAPKALACFAKNNHLIFEDQEIPLARGVYWAFLDSPTVGAGSLGVRPKKSIF